MLENFRANVLNNYIHEGYSKWQTNLVTNSERVCFMLTVENFGRRLLQIALIEFV